MFKRYLLAVLFVAISLVFEPLLAEAHFIDGYIADCSATTSTTCTEFTATGYSRQPMFFNAPTSGVTRNAAPFSFSPLVTGVVAGRAIYDAPSGGTLLLIIPLAAPLTITGGGDHQDVGTITLTFTAMVPLYYSESYIGTAAAGSTLGSTADGSTLTNSHDLTFLRGIMLPGTITPGA